MYSFEKQDRLLSPSDLMENLSKVTKGVISFSKNLPESSVESVIDAAKSLAIDAFLVLEAFEVCLYSIDSELEDSNPSVQRLGDLAAMLPSAQNSRDLRVSCYHSSLHELYPSKYCIPQIRNYLRTIDRCVVQPLIGAKVSDSLGEALRALVNSGQIRRRLPRSYFVARLSWHLKDLRKARRALKKSLAGISELPITR